MSPAIASKIEDLARIDPAQPLADPMAMQTLSLFGREDLIAPVSDSYKPTMCAPLTPATPPLEEIVRRARLTSIVIVNESHERSEHRGFTTQIARRLRALGYDTMAIETLSNPPAGVPERYLPAFLVRPSLPYFEDGDGHYLSEAGFGRLGRQVKMLGYRLLPYEMTGDGGLPQDASSDQRVAVREEIQARNLALFIREHPRAKMLIHVGYSHAGEVPRADGARWMATRLKQKTGIDPLTISQTTCRGGSDTVHLSMLPAKEMAGTFDLVVDHPSARFASGRPDWRKAAGDRLVAIPRELRPATGWRVIEARPIGEPDTSVPVDRVAIRPNEEIALMLPPGRYHVRTIDVTPDRKESSKQ
ncbi:MAG: hypothetical protein V4595_03685 [Pseudomonadota bacterium]